MSRVEDIKGEIRELSPAEFAELREWVLGVDHDAWDHQFEADAAAGRLDSVFKQGAVAHPEIKHVLGRFRGDATIVGDIVGPIVSPFS